MMSMDARLEGLLCNVHLIFAVQTSCMQAQMHPSGQNTLCWPKQTTLCRPKPTMGRANHTVPAPANSEQAGANCV